MRAGGVELAVPPPWQWFSHLSVPHIHLACFRRHRLTNVVISGSRGSGGLDGTQESSSFPVLGDTATALPSSHCESLGCKTALSDLYFLNL